MSYPQLHQHPSLCCFVGPMLYYNQVTFVSIFIPIQDTPSSPKMLQSVTFFNTFCPSEAYALISLKGCNPFSIARTVHKYNWLLFPSDFFPTARVKPLRPKGVNTQLREGCPANGPTFSTSIRLITGITFPTRVVRFSEPHYFLPGISFFVRVGDVPCEYPAALPSSRVCLSGNESW